MKYLVPLVLLFFTLVFWLALEDTANLGRQPSDEQLICTQERNKVTGELYNVQIVRCRICGQVLSYMQFHLNGKLAGASHYSHHCGRYGNNAPIVRYNGSAVYRDFSLIDWLESWQRRLRIRH